MSQPEWYNFYRVSYAGITPRVSPHSAIALVPVERANQLKGELHHVIGYIGAGLRYEVRQDYPLNRCHRFEKADWMGLVDGTKECALHAAINRIPPPKDERFEYETRQEIEARGEVVRDCHAWVDEVVDLLRSEGILVERRSSNDTVSGQPHSSPAESRYLTTTAFYILRIMGKLSDNSGDDLPSIRSILQPRNSRQMPSSSSLRRSPRKHATSHGAVEPADSQIVQAVVFTASSDQRQLISTNMSPSKRSPLKSSRQPKAAEPVFKGVPILPRKDRLEKENRDASEKPSLGRANKLGLTHVDSLLLPLSKMAMRNDSTESESEPSFLATRASRKAKGTSVAPQITRTARTANLRNVSATMVQQKSSKSAASRYVLDEARCNEDLLDSDANNDGTEDEDTDLSGFIVDDNAELSYHESTGPESNDSEVDRRVRKAAVARTRPRRRLQRGRKKDQASEDEMDNKDGGHRDELVDAIRGMRIDGGQNKHRAAEAEESICIDLTTPEVRSLSQDKSKDLKNPSTAVENLFDKFNALRLSPPRHVARFDVPSKTRAIMSISDVEDESREDAQKDDREDRVATPPATPPRSPSKLKSPSKLLSPSKRAGAVHRSPHRPSMDAFWDLNEVNEWNDRFSPKKAPLASPRKAVKHFDLYADSDDELECIDESSDGLPSPCDSPTKPRANSSPIKSPEKNARRKAQEEKKAKLALKQKFDAEKDQMAKDLLEALDKYVAQGQIGTLSTSTGGVKVIWSKTLRSTAGRANWKRSVIKPSGSPVKGAKPGDEQVSGARVEHYANIELATKIIDRPERLYSTLAHEFCHLANFMISNVHDQPHGQSFCRWAAKATQYLQSQTRVSAWQQTEISIKHSYVIEYKYAWICAGREGTKAMAVLDIGDEEGCGTEYGRHSNSINTDTQRCGVCKGRLIQIRPKPRASPKKSASPLKRTTKAKSALIKAIEVIELSD